MTSAYGKLLIVGSVNVDMIMGVLDTLPRRGTEVMMQRSETRIGGNAANTAFAFRALGGAFQVAANIGRDMFGDWVAESFPQDSAHWPRSTQPTTLTVALTHSDGERTFLTSPGHLAVLTLGDLLAQIPAHAGKGDAALLCSPFLSPLLMDDFSELIAELRRRGFAVALDTGWPPEGWSPALRSRVAHWLQGVDHVLLNEIEALALTDEPTLEKALAALSRMAPSATAVIKRGPQGAAAWRDGQVLTVSAPVVEVVDTIGAGDIFNAGYLLGCLRGAELDASLRLGVETASFAISTLPRRYGAVA